MNTAVPTVPDTMVPEYMVYFPEGDVWGLTELVAPGWYGPAVSDGYYLMLAPLSAGQHTIHFAVADFLDVTYHVTVAGARN